jgi:hypothetical protein
LIPEASLQYEIAILKNAGHRLTVGAVEAHTIIRYEASACADFSAHKLEL